MSVTLTTVNRISKGFALLVVELDAGYDTLQATNRCDTDVVSACRHVVNSRDS